MARTINLYDGLEALYYFDSDYFNNGSNEISDQSGHGRHAEASGGPTVGVNGPAGFEATSFDGIDDQFDPSGITVFSDKSYTNAALVNGKYNKVYSQHRGAGDRVNFRSGSDFLRYGYADSNGDFYDIKFSPLSDFEDRWILLVNQYDESTDTHRFYADGQTKTSRGDGFTVADSGQNNHYTIGSNYDGSGIFFDGEIAYVARWSRALSTTEIEQLDRLTGPRRAML